MPRRAWALVIFAHGGGSSRFSTRNRRVAEYLDSQGVATLLLDLLTQQEEAARLPPFGTDIPRLGSRIRAAAEWVSRRPDLRDMPMGCFGVDGGAAAALTAAADRPDLIRAVVSRSGRPDLAGEALGRVTAPTLLIVGGAEAETLDVNRDALLQMQAPVALEEVPEAGPLFEEPGALQRVESLTVAWFRRHLTPDGVAPDGRATAS